MKSKFLVFLTVCMIFFYQSIIAQNEKMILPDQGREKAVKNIGSALMSTPLSGTISPALIRENWDITLQNKHVFHHTSPVSKEEFEALKKKANAIAEPGIKSIQTLGQSRADSIAPSLHRNFRGNLRGNSVPMDNTMAISRNGFIVSGINTNVIFAQPDGNVTFTKSLADFFFLLNLGTRMYDPRAIYDPVENKFIFMCLYGSEPSATNLCIAFSETEDPNGNWHFYKLPGNPGDNKNWFDYPNIAVSTHDFYTAGLMRNPDGDWQYSVLYQMDKQDGFQGKPLRWKHYKDLFNEDQEPSFNLVPAPSGWNTLVGPGMYFVSNEALGGNKYNLYYTDESLHKDPVLFSLQTTAQETELAPDGRMKNSPKKLNTFDSRIWSALYLDGVIHMGSHVHTGTENVGLFYGRMKISDFEVYSDVLVSDSIDYGFPSFSTLGNTESSDTILVNYLFSGPGIFPGQQQRICTGKDSTFNWSRSTTLKEGLSSINVLTDNLERWGDYTTSSRRFMPERVETWVTGCFGETNSYGTWLGQYINQDTTNKPLIVDFVANKTTFPKDTSVQFTDLINKENVNYFWRFENGNPATSTEKNPRVQWATNGAYSVSLKVEKDGIQDSITKVAYIHVQEPEALPVADFEYDRDTIFRGDTIQFFNRCSPNTKILKWTFTQGSPGASTEENPRVRYPLKGQFTVNLVAVNIAGTDSKTVPKAITVLERFSPTANFSSNKTQILPGDTIQFSDVSSGGPTSWEWVFEGGTPSISTSKSPLVSYANEGVYSVQLKVKNNFGQDSVQKIGYITVGSSSTNVPEVPSIYRVYPNPVQAGERITFILYQPQSKPGKIEILDANGRQVKMVWNDLVKQGENEFQFNTSHLSPGVFYLQWKSSLGSAIVPFVVF